MVRSFIRKKQDLQKDEYVCITNNLIFLLQKVHIVLNSCKNTTNCQRSSMRKYQWSLTIIKDEIDILREQRL